METNYHEHNSAIELIKEKALQSKIHNESLTKAIDEWYYKVLYRSYEVGNNVSMQSIINMYENDEFDLPSDGGRVSVIKYTEDNVIKFKAIFSGKATLLRHFHDDAIEYVLVDSDTKFKVILGSIEGGDLKEVEITSGERLVIPPKMQHQISHLDKTKGVLIVNFDKNVG